MQMQNQQQAPQSCQASQKPARKRSLLLGIIGFTLTLLLLIVTGILFLKTSATSPSSLLSALFTIFSAIFTFFQLSPIFFPPQSEPTTAIHHHYYTTPDQPHASTSHVSVQTSKQIFRFNMPLNDPAEFYGRAHARTTLLSRTANGGSSSIVGERRMGKTWLMEYLQLVAPTQKDLGPRFRVGYLSATHPQCKTLAGFTVKALEVLKVPTSHLDQAHIQFSQLAKAIVDLKAQDIVPVLCIDEFEGFDSKQEFNQNFVEGLRAMTQDDGLILITASRRPLADIIIGMTGQTSPLFNIIQQLTLKPFIEPEAVKFVQDKSSQAGFNDLERAYFSKCATTYSQDGEKQWFPLRLQLLGQMLLDDKQAAQHEPQRYRLEDVRYQVDFEKRLAEEYQAVVKHL